MSGAVSVVRDRRPEWKVVVHRQLELVARGRRRELLLLGGVVAVLVLGTRFPGGSAPATVPSAAQILVGSSHILLMLVALLWPTSVWRDEGPSRRAYHWTLPVDRRLHDLIRVAAGAACLLGSIVLGSILGFGFSLAIGGGIPPGDWEVYPGMILALLTLYGFSSVAALVSDHPFRWIAGVPILYFAVRSLTGSLGLDPVASVLGALETGRLGLATAIFGPRSFTSSFWGAVLADGSPLLAGLLWFVVAAIVVLAASSLHLERSGADG